MINLSSPLEKRLTGIPAVGREMARSGRQARRHLVSESPHPDPPPPNGEMVTAERATTRPSSSFSSRSDFGPYSALRSFDEADPRELAGEGWNSDADWGYGGPEPCCSEVDGGKETKHRRRKDSASDLAPLRRSKRRRDHRARQYSWIALGPPRPGDAEKRHWGRRHWGGRAQYNQPQRCALIPPHLCRRGPSSWRHTSTAVLSVLV
jgi:hypothetical protein